VNGAVKSLKSGLTVNRVSALHNAVLNLRPASPSPLRESPKFTLHALASGAVKNTRQRRTKSACATAAIAPSSAELPLKAFPCAVKGIQIGKVVLIPINTGQTGMRNRARQRNKMDTLVKFAGINLVVIRFLMSITLYHSKNLTTIGNLLIN